LAPMDRDWSVFVHVQDGIGAIVGQTDTLPGLGTIATSDLRPGRRWSDTYTIQINDSAYAPESLQVNVGLYDTATCPACQRMMVATSVADHTDQITLGQLDLQPHPSADAVPNPVQINFANSIELIGFEVTPRQVMPNDHVEVKLYW